ncbi:MULTISPECIES: helix-turn-helix transcriptional regulator [Micrococcales]|uniref:Helix-turn-helix transcriptional regulator n=1 Tax=Brevibacterium luteolum TaxID=199591 RepID=A0A849B5B6_9MICO|nr:MULTISPECIES: helix-turn-helix transcriptional regulator [Micrococcales]MBM7529189.1 AraC-like DNA-binding protein [Brevibacterium luteolum]NNG80376.1 helix-turn-helix transcriptional regulator [Brevibacterium luteolum]PMC74335.1 AraC family transcriptional regulator [Brachybacterium sp. UMB0905]
MTGHAALRAVNRTIYRSVGPVAYDFVKLIVVRDGSAILFSEFGEHPINVGDVVLLAANTLCGSEPEGHITVSTIYADSDYVLDQLFWQHVDMLCDRLDTQDFADTIYTEPAQILRLGEHRAGMLMPWVDELVALTTDELARSRFHRAQALWFSIIDQVSPFIEVSPHRIAPNQRAHIRPTLPRERRFAPLRAEARQVEALLRGDVAHDWNLTELADAVHLSPKQLSRVFVEAFGKTPLAYLTMLRVQEMSRQLREPEVSIAEAGRRVGWQSRNRATEAFREHAGITPTRYRQMQLHPESRRPTVLRPAVL